jgi:hypothetical protein
LFAWCDPCLFSVFAGGAFNSGAGITPVSVGGAFGAPSRSSFGTTTFESTPAFGQFQAEGSNIFGQFTGMFFGQSTSAFGASGASGASMPAFGSDFDGKGGQRLRVL